MHSIPMGEIPIKIHAVILVFNSADTILDCLKSIDGKVDEILCFDGRWKGFDYPSDHSTDETQKIILKFSMSSKSQVYYVALPVMHQHEARTEAINQVINGDWIISLDSDEVFIKIPENIKEILTNTNEKGYRICGNGRECSYATHPTFRLVKKTEGMHWSTDHRRVFDKDGELDLLHFPPLLGMVFNHHPLTGNKKMRSCMEQYKVWLRKWEIAHPVP